MIDEQAVDATAVLFLKSLQGILLTAAATVEGRGLYAPGHHNRTLSSAVVMVAWGKHAINQCFSRLKPEYGNQCWHDHEHVVLSGGIHFHTKAFQSIGG